MKSFYQLYILTLVGILFPSAAYSQIVPDATVGTQLMLNGAKIDGGAIRGNNLFHSFQEFNINAGQSVYFTNPINITNIFTRVTGGKPSNINGILGVDGNANLFFMNPNGVIFGNSSTLDIKGSFLATSASSINFADGTQFNVGNTQVNPMLTVTVPVGLGFGSNLGAITNLSKSSLSVPNGRTLALIGGDILLDGGQLFASEGRIELGGVGANNTVTLNSSNQGWEFAYSGVTTFKDIHLTNLAVAGVGGAKAGSMQMVSRNLTISNGAYVDASTTGSGTGGVISIKASESLEVNGLADEGVTPSRITSQIYAGETGKGSSIQIEAQRLKLKNGAQVVAGIYDSSGESGNINVKATDIEISGTSLDGGYPSGLFANLFEAKGKGGNLNIDTQNLRLSNGGQFSAGVYGNSSGTGGNIFVKASVIEADKISSNGWYPSGFFVDVSGGSKGEAGNIAINTKSLQLTNGALISAGIFSGSGVGGDITVQANDIYASGFQSYYVSGFIASVFEATAPSQGGSITINTQNMRLLNGARAATEIYGSDGQAGDLNIKAREIEVRGIGVDLIGSEERRSSISASVSSEATGKGGNLQIDTQVLRILDGAGVETNTIGIGNAGDLSIKATELLEISGTNANETFSSKLTAGVGFGAKGNGGELNINAGLLLVTNGGTVSASTYGNGNAGNVNITTSSVDVRGNGNIEGKLTPSSIATISTTDFSAGSLAINANQVNVSDKGKISVSGFGTGGGGNLDITAKKIQLNNSGSLSAEVNAGNRGNLRLNADTLLMRQGSSISTNASSAANGGNITLNAGAVVLLEGSKISADAGKGTGGNITITSQGIFQSRNSQITATGNVSNGEIELITPDIKQDNALKEQSSNFITTDTLTASSCLANTNAQQGKFAVTGSGGVPEAPYGDLNGTYSILQVNSTNSNNIVGAEQTSKNTSWKLGDPIKEAQNLQVINGRVVLTAQPYQQISQADNLTCNM
jgi:filamentous hemagglutinin family protein